MSVDWRGLGSRSPAAWTRARHERARARLSLVAPRPRRVVVWALAGAAAAFGVVAVWPRQQRIEPAATPTARDAIDVTALTDDAAIEPRPRTSDGRAVYALVRGAARFSTGGDGSHRVRVLAEGLVVDDVGTVFSVAIERDGELMVHVDAGLVTVTPAGVGGAPSFVGAGETRRFPRPTPAFAGPQTRPRRALAPAEPRRPSVEELWGRADRARAAGDSAGAIAALRDVLSVAPDDRLAPVARFTMARLLLDELGRAEDAARAFDGVVVGPLAEPALARAVEAWAAAGQPEQARRRAQEYLRRYPNGERRQEVKRHAELP